MSKFIVPNWTEAWKWLSMWLSLAAVVFGTLDQPTQAAVLTWFFGLSVERVPAVVGLLIMVSRMINQSKVDK